MSIPPGPQTLPASDTVESGYLESMLHKFSSSYKLYWFKGIFTEILKGERILEYKRLVARMIAAAWYPVVYFNLSLGHSDNLADAIWYIHRELKVPREEQEEKIVEFVYSCDDKRLLKKVKDFTNMVPYRLIRPFYQREIEFEKKIDHTFKDKDVNGLIEKFGYDGVELHGCHQYLLCEFFNARVNRRTDEYGRYPERLAVEILKGIKAHVPKEFLVGIRLGGFEPDLKTSQRFAKILEKKGIDFLDISYGFSGEDEPYAPDDFLFQTCIYAAQEIKMEVSVPVFAVNSIMSPEMAEEVLQKTNVDLVDIARGIMVNPNWAEDAQEGRDTGRCLHCRECSWSEDMETCKGRILLKRQREKRQSS